MFIGYSHQLNIFKLKRTAIEGKFLISPTYYLKGGHLQDNLTANYLSNDTIFAGYKVSQLSGMWGNGGEGVNGRLLTEINIGLRKQLSTGICNNFYVGLYASNNFRVNTYGEKTEANSDVTLTNGHYIDGRLQNYTQNFFNSQDLTIGLRLGLCLKLQ